MKAAMKLLGSISLGAGVALLGAVLGPGIGGPAPVGAAAAVWAAGPAHVTLTGDEHRGVVNLVAMVTRASGSPVKKARVRFLVVTTEFGPKGERVPLGSAVTNRKGVARFTYNPTFAGHLKFVAQARAGASSSAMATVAVPSVRLMYRDPSQPFARLGKGLILALLSIVGAVWVLLVWQVGRVRRACRVNRTRFEAEQRAPESENSTEAARERAQWAARSN